MILEDNGDGRWYNIPEKWPQDLVRGGQITFEAQSFDGASIDEALAFVAFVRKLGNEESH